MKHYELDPIQRLFLESTIKSLETINNDTAHQIIEELKNAENQETANKLIDAITLLAENSKDPYKRVFEESFDFLVEHYENFRAHNLRSALYVSPVKIDWLL